MDTYECVLAIDPALSTTGWAIIDYNQNLKRVGKFNTSSDSPDYKRIHAISYELLKEAKEFPVREIILEDGYIGVNAKTGLQLATLRGAIVETFISHKYGINMIKPSKIRSMFAKKGNASKEEIADAVIAFYGNDSKLINNIGPYSNKQNKKKTSDIYDAISIGLAYIRAEQSKLLD